ncbi:MAG: sigma factor-like helix-turn-helix DNA-binding protein [Lachnospiraceae bacterium]|nr:sigma factor-like helix-turn-helix DNA-binding protein [Lachnospiraceae bacterium]
MEITIKINGQAVSVEVSVEVYQYLDRADHKDENLAHEQRRHWDGREFDEYIVATEGAGIYGETPEEYICRRETLDELLAVLNGCTETQRRRFLLHALDGLSYEQIGQLCGCSKYAVRDSVEAVRKKFQDFFKNRPHETPFSG